MTPLAPHTLIAKLNSSDYAFFIDQLRVVFKEMDDAYNVSAGKNGFVCRGCDDNCCRSFFYHYTLLEYAYLLEGLKGLDQKSRDKVLKRTKEVAKKQTGPEKAMCPLNSDGACILYDQRPMICRLHGIPHILQSPAGVIVPGPGCADFVRQGGSSTASPLDRTPLYRQMSALEKILRQTAGADLKFKMTIAQMIVEADKEKL